MTSSVKDDVLGRHVVNPTGKSTGLLMSCVIVSFFATIQLPSWSKSAEAFDVEAYEEYLQNPTVIVVIPSDEASVISRRSWQEQSQNLINKNKTRWAEWKAQRRHLNENWKGLLESQAQWWENVSELSEQDRTLEGIANLADIASATFIRAGLKGLSGEGGSLRDVIQKETKITQHLLLPAIETCMEDGDIQVGCDNVLVGSLVVDQMERITRTFTQASEGTSKDFISALKEVKAGDVFNAIADDLGILSGHGSIQCVEGPRLRARRQGIDLLQAKTQGSLWMASRYWSVTVIVCQDIGRTGWRQPITSNRLRWNWICSVS